MKRPARSFLKLKVHDLPDASPKGAADRLHKLRCGTFQSSTKGIFEVKDREKRRICSAIKFISHEIDEPGTTTVRVRLTDHGGTRREVSGISVSLFANGAGLVQRLMDCGLVVDDAALTRNYLVERYQTKKPRKTVRIVSQPGWHPLDNGRLTYVSDNAPVSLAKGGEVFLRLADSVDSGWGQSGSIIKWRSAVGKLAKENPLLQFVIAAALAAPTLHLLNLANLEFHLLGEPRTGKSTGLKVAASVYGNNNNLFQSWNGTGKAIPVFARHRNDGVLLLDELSQGNPRDVADLVFDLANGDDRLRLTSDAKLRDRQKFRGILISDGNISLREHLASKGVPIISGQIARFVTIPVDPAYGMFPGIRGAQRRAALACQLEETCSSVYGALGREWIDYLVQHQRTVVHRLRTMINRYTREMETTLVDSPVPVGIRSSIVRGFAVVAAAGELAIREDLLLWPKGDAFEAVKSCVSAWDDYERQHCYDPEDDAMVRMRRFFQSESARNFVSMRSYSRVKRDHLAGFEYVINGEDVFLVYAAFFEDKVCSGFGKSIGIAALKKYGLLIPGGNGRPRKQVRIPNQDNLRIAFYVIRKKILLD